MADASRRLLRLHGLRGLEGDPPLRRRAGGRSGQATPPTAVGQVGPGIMGQWQLCAGLSLPMPHLWYASAYVRSRLRKRERAMATVTKRERVQAALRGEVLDRPPLAFW